MEKKRSVGIIILSIINMLMALYCVFNERWFFAPIYIVAGIGILLLKPFARYLAIVFSGYGIISLSVLFIYLLIKEPRAWLELTLVIPYILTVIYNSFIIYFLTRPKVKRQFIGANPVDKGAV